MYAAMRNNGHLNAHIRRSSVLIPGIALVAALSGCGGSVSVGNLPVQKNITLNTDFNQGVTGWSGGSSDYEADTQPTDLAWESKPLQSPLSGNALYLAGHNRSDDLFVYAKKQFSNLSPNTTYKISFEVKIGSNVPDDCVGVGGSPGNSVWIYAAASPTEPKTVIGSDGYYGMSINKGNQATAGTEAQNLGDISTTAQDCGDYTYQTKILKSATPLTAKSDAAGRIWLLVGMDSGFEAFSKVYVMNFNATLAQ
ncbi:MAG: hypothetical protein K0S28_2493 [Paucimonas sp.]|nr:hypothetical protein [Paucimonas sp.]